VRLQMLTRYMQRADQCIIGSGMSFRLMSGGEGRERVSAEGFAACARVAAQMIGNE